MKSVKLKPSANLDILREGTYLDCRVPGLVLRVGKHRSSWSVRYRKPGESQPVIEQFGVYPAIGWKAARTKAEAIRDGEVPAKGEPIAVKKEPTFGELLEEYAAYRNGAGHRVADFKRVMACLIKYLEPHLDEAATAFTRRDFFAIRDAIVMEGKTPTAIHLQAYVAKFLKHVNERDERFVNFLAGIAKVAKPNVDDRVLSTKEITSVWTTSASDHPQHRLVRFMLLTGCRRGEAAALRYRDITADGMWELKEHKAKDSMGTAFHPLSKAALAVVDKGDPDALVFPAQGGGIFSCWSDFMNEFRAESGTKDWSLKALRATMATTMAAELGISTEIIHRCQGHAQQGVAVHYLHTQRPIEQLAAFEAWSAHIVPKPLAVASKR